MSLTDKYKNKNGENNKQTWEEESWEFAERTHRNNCSRVWEMGFEFPFQVISTP